LPSSVFRSALYVRNLTINAKGPSTNTEYHAIEGTHSYTLNSLPHWDILKSYGTHSHSS
jgi:hypothetical protein